MRVDVRDPLERRRRLGRVEIESAARPSRAKIVGKDREVFLNWDAAIDDGGHLRSCLICGCRDLYKVRTFPQITGLVVVLAFAGAVVGILQLTEDPLVFAALLFVLVLDIAILIFSRTRLVCYKCRSMYFDIKVTRHHLAWDRSTAGKYEAAVGSPGHGAESLKFTSSDTEVHG